MVGVVCSTSQQVCCRSDRCHSVMQGISSSSRPTAMVKLDKKLRQAAAQEAYLLGQRHIVSIQQVSILPACGSDKRDSSRLYCFG